MVFASVSHFISRPFFFNLCPYFAIISTASSRGWFLFSIEGVGTANTWPHYSLSISNFAGITYRGDTERLLVNFITYSIYHTSMGLQLMMESLLKTPVLLTDWWCCWADFEVWGSQFFSETWHKECLLYYSYSALRLWSTWYLLAG